MTVYQHKKGKIRDNAIEALLHDPLFKPRIEVNQKGKGSYRRKDKHAGKGNWEASGKNAKQILTTGFLVSGEKKPSYDGFLPATAGCFVASADRGFQ